MKVGLDTSDEMVTLMTDRRRTTASRRPATRRLRLIAGGDVAPVNTDLIPNYEDVFAVLKNQPHNTVDGAALRRPARPGRQHPDVQPGRRHDAARQLVDGVRRPTPRTRARSPPTTARSTSPTRRCTSWRPSPTSGSRTRTSSTRRSSTRPSTCSSSRSALVGKYWGTAHRRDRRRSRTATWRSGTTWPYQANTLNAAGGAVKVEVDQAQGGHDRLVRHLDDVDQGQAPELHATSGWTR